jgi:anhydro-N-acetylmuramic acid kinase
MNKPTDGGAGKSLYIGLMSGTSVDAIDCAIIDCGGGAVALLATHEHPIPDKIRDDISRISHAGDDEIERMGRLDRTLGELFAESAVELLRSSGTRARDVIAIGSHGQTIRHRPPSSSKVGEASFTLQVGDPNTIAELTGITTVADFRRRDIAAGGEGAPLAPAFHAAAFSTPTSNRAIINIGGIANASLLRGGELIGGFDTGPGNTLLDHWISRAHGSRYDLDGAWAAEGEVVVALLQSLMQHPYLSKTGPRSTGKEAFNLNWLEQRLAELPPIDPRNVQATLAEFTAETICLGLSASALSVDEVYICGGGAHNTDLMRRLYRKLGSVLLDTTAAIGIDPDWVEAAAFGWLARQTMERLPGNASVVTGSAGERILGGIYLAGKSPAG